MSQDRDYAIRQLAYELWEKDGKPAGKHLDYWLLAEDKLSSETEDASAVEPAASTERQPS